MTAYLATTLLTHAENLTEPAGWAQAAPRIAAERAGMEGFVAAHEDRHFYGINTFPGHLDHVKLSQAQIEEFQTYLIDDHSIGSGVYYNELEARAIGYCKAQQVSLGGTGVTPSLFAHLRAGVADASFAPSVPKYSSYSCGDVIPAAHWAGSLIKHKGYIKATPLAPKEGMALINGSFVHAGVALAKLRSLKRLFDSYLLSAQLASLLCRPNPSNQFVSSLETSDPYLLAAGMLGGGAKQKDVQDPISVRCMPQVLGSLAYAIAEYLRVLDLSLTRQSDNPLYDPASNDLKSQGSFLDPLLTLTTGQLVEAWLLALWALERRFHYLLSGQCEGIPMNGANEDDFLGFIQAPKRASAILEQIRLMTGRRSFASGGSTSYGVEDLWSNGLLTLDQLYFVLVGGHDIIAHETAVNVSLMRRFRPELADTPAFRLFAKAPQDFRENVAFCKQAAKEHSNAQGWAWPFKKREDA